jgi:hypothetical protein
MANIVVAKGFWASAGDATHLQPGGVHDWTWGLGTLNEAITFTAFPLSSFNTGVLMVEDLRILEGRGRLAKFRVRNVGGTPIQQYGVTGSFIS